MCQPVIDINNEGVDSFFIPTSPGQAHDLAAETVTEHFTHFIQANFPANKILSDPRKTPVFRLTFQTS